MQSTIHETLDHVLLLARHLNKCDISCAATVVLMELGVPTKCIGFEYLKRAILMLHEDPTRSLSKDIYLKISLRCKTGSEEPIEQAIRDAISKAWKSGSLRAWNWYFAYDGQLQDGRPSNSEFISRIVRVLQLWQGCYRKEACYAEQTKC